MYHWISKILDTWISWSLLLTVFNLPLVLQKVKMNHLWGFRIGKAYESEENWYKINKFGGDMFLLSAVIFFIIGLLQFFGIMPISPHTDSIQNVIFYVLLILPVIVTIIYSFKI